MSDNDRLLPGGVGGGVNELGKESQIVYALIARGTVVLTEYTHPSTYIHTSIKDERERGRERENPFRLLPFAIVNTYVNHHACLSRRGGWRTFFRSHEIESFIETAPRACCVGLRRGQLNPFFFFFF